MKDKKGFHAVKMMHDIRDKRHSEYEKDPQLREERLTAIRKKYAEKDAIPAFFRGVQNGYCGAFIKGRDGPLSCSWWCDNPWHKYQGYFQRGS